MHIYFGWKCRTEDCGEEIHYKYLGDSPLKTFPAITVPALLLVTCRKCHQKYDYSDQRPQHFLSAIPPTEHQKSM